MYQIVQADSSDQKLAMIQQLNQMYLIQFIDFMTQIQVYRDKERILQYALLIEQEKKMKRCPNGFNKNENNLCVQKVKKKMKTQKRCPIGSRKKVHCEPIQVKQPKCPKGSRRKHVYCKKTPKKKPRCSKGKQRKQVYCVEKKQTPK